MAKSSALDSIVLPSWPTCTNNLAWSEDHLAVAAGEVIHILTPRSYVKSSLSDSSSWHVETIRVNQFTDKEWPVQELAPLKSLSLGEEQSNSSVCSLGWSSAGVGVHKRNVLAVLTTNLLLSLWESTGTPGSWQRTFIVNKKLHVEGRYLNRRGQRIRAFSWLPILDLSQNHRKALQYLITADDDDKISLFHVQKPNYSSIGNWDVALLYSHRLSQRGDGSNSRAVSVFQQALQVSPITAVEPGGWQKLMDETGAVCVLRLKVAFQRGAPQTTCPGLLLSCEPQDGNLQFHGHTTEASTSANCLSWSPPPESIESALTKPTSDFDKRFDLRGHVRTRHWGAARSPDGSRIAACVTFHPSDMIEYNTASSERCTVIFALGQSATFTDSNTSLEKDVKLDLLLWIAKHSSMETIKTDVDAKLVRVAAACVETAYNSDPGLMEWSRGADEMAKQFEIVSDDGDDADADDEGDFAMEKNPPLNPAIGEPCEICGAAISTSQDLSSARCSQGHTFSRCGISFLSIQEPGISKYCSRCGRQFLDLSKLKPQTGPSLCLALFEEFDVCPYCRGKFRG